MRLYVLTAVTRPENLSAMGESIALAKSRAPSVDVRWHLRFDMEREDVGGQRQKNWLINQINNGWVCILDDDTFMHHDFLRKVDRARQKNLSVEAIVVSQKRTTGVVLQARPENVKVGMIDAGQVVLRRSVIGESRIPPTYAGDGEWLESLLVGRNDVVYLKEVLSLHNALSGVDVSETPERMGA